MDIPCTSEMTPFTLPTAPSLFSLLGLYVEVRNAVNSERVHILVNDYGLKSLRESNFYSEEKSSREEKFYSVKFQKESLT